MSRQFFGTDGIRGRVGDQYINTEFMLKLGWSIGQVIRHAHQTPRVLIGRDTRISGSVLQASLESGLASAGVKVQALGVIPTPAVAHLTQSLRAQAGIVISASHNPFYDNGIKIFNADGMKLSDALELEVEAFMRQPMEMLESGALGVVGALQDARARYIEFCKSTFPKQLTLEGLKLVVDCANGACFEVAPAVFRELGADVTLIGADPNGLNINDHCGATHTNVLQKVVLSEKADLGIALDGDGDRLIMVDHEGQLIDGDQILCILAREATAKLQTHAGIVGTVMSNLGLEQSLQSLGVAFERTRVGDRYVLERLLDKGWTLGGEASGHIVNLDYSTTGDGIISALQVLRVMRLRDNNLSTLSKGMVKRPQTLINVPREGEVDLQHDKIEQAVQKAETQLGNRGRILIRPSGTEPYTRVMVEGNDAKEVQQIAERLAMVIASHSTVQ